MKNILTRVFPLVLAALLPLAACQDDKMTGPEDGSATLSVFLTDAPGDMARVWVELLELTAKGGEGGPIDLLGEPTDLVLLTDLVGTVQLLSINAELDPTTISQLRMVIGDAVLEDIDGAVYVKGDPVLPEGLEPETVGDLHCPSCSQSGIKVKVPNDEVEVEEGSTALVIDFDVAQSFGHKAGNSGKWVMHPVIHATFVVDENGDGDILDDLGFVGSIKGNVAWASGVEILACPTDGTPTLADFVPTATLVGLLDGEGQPIVRAGSIVPENDTFTFTIGFLSAGSYTMGFVGTVPLTNDQVTFTADLALGDVVVSDGEVGGADYTVTSVTCQPMG